MSKTDDIKQQSNKIWLAGLGAYSLIEESGIESFESLIEKGRELERTHQTKEATSSNDSRLNELKGKANQTMDRIEKAFDMRVSSALGRLGISRKSDLEHLDKRIDDLALTLDKIYQELATKEKKS